MKGKLFKRVTAMVLAFAMVGAALPQDSGFANLFGDTAITASAETRSATEGDFTYSYDDASSEMECTLTGYSGDQEYVEIPQTLGGRKVTMLGENSLSSNPYIKHIKLPDTLETIGYCSICNCKALEELDVPDSVIVISDFAVNDCTSLTSLKIGSGVKSIGRSAFNNTGLKRLTVPKNVTALGVMAFANNNNLKTVVVEGSSYIGEEAFYCCQALETVVLEPGVSAIDKCAFQNCTNLKTVTIPSTVHSIGEKAFDNTGDDLVLVFDGTKEQWDAISGSSSVPEKVKVAFTADSGVRLYGHSLSLIEDGNIGVNFYMMLPESIRKSKTAIVRFTIPTSASQSGYIVNDVPAGKPRRAEIMEDGTEYSLFACEVAAKEMTSQITAQVIDEENGIYGPVYSYSVKEYADYIIDHQDDSEIYAKAVDLVKAMLNYGAYSQIYFDKNTSDLANADLTEDEKDVSGVTADDINKPYDDFEQLTVIGEEISFDQVALALRSNTELLLYFTCEDELSVECEQDKNAYMSKSGKYQVAHITGIRADKLADDYTVTVSAKKGGAKIIKYCPLTYCYYVVKESRGSKALQDVCKALFLFYQAADSYF